MSSHGYSSECPMCDGKMECVTYTRPYDSTSGLCLECGFHYWTQEGQVTLDEVNEQREDYGFKPLKKLRKRKE